MKTIQFKELHRIDFDIHKIILLHQHWTNGESFPIPEKGRPDNGIMFLSHCAFDYIDAQGKVYDHAPKGSLLYSPKGSNYTCRFRVDTPLPKNDDCTNYLINFLLFDEKGEEFILSKERMLIPTDKGKFFCNSFARIDSLGKMALPSPARIKAMLYDLLCDISQELQKSDIMSRSYASIYPAIKYIRHTALSEIDPAALAGLCHISDSCFRRLFREYTGMAPLEYVNHLKIKQAQKMLQSGALTVSEVAESLGYADVSYFSRFYKKITGHTPREDRG